MEYERTSFWWGFAGGALAAYTFVFLVIAVIAFMAGLNLKDVAIFFAVISGIFALLISFGKVLSSRSTGEVRVSRRTKKGLR